MILKNNINILLIEDEEYDVRRVKNTLTPFQDKIKISKVVADGESALKALKKNSNNYDVIIMDFQIVGGITGESLIRAIKQIDDTLQIIVVTKMTVNISDFDFANALLEAGAMWYCTKYPGDIENYIYQPTDFILSIINAYQKRKLEIKQRNADGKLKKKVDEILSGKQILGNSKAIQTVREQIERAALQDATVLIYGASGTGKELVAKHIHYKSKRKYEKLITVNSGSLPHELIESELFGFERGSFTGAYQDKKGLFEVANNSSIFLDEIGELPLSAQVKLLRVLQEGEIDKIGRTEKIKINARIIAATNVDLQEAIANKTFREDLFYRLNVVNINIPPLKKRPEDIPLLVDFFINKYIEELSMELPKMEDGVLDLLQKFPWPGNVRQLQNVLQRLLFVTHGTITTDDVENALGFKREFSRFDTEKSTINWEPGHILPWREMEKKLKRDYFQFVRNQKSSDAEAAKELGLAPPNYYRMCKELGLK
ncbi:MAG: sigma-54-dependent Fis family transcriptional regulator [Calditrichaeota bacterium]|nr:MAG: sigma-54-dependent Fis family transcriptional regulator [Calditrichota bacterium]MBL1205194.1 sigma-54-dependent Fis family transcriptional regulator [Calditrichota bacterium]NOG45024.1 sigma-54-dependent Fis family transcriptional regulator [Calditrichota bacterium]